VPESLSGLVERVTFHNPENGFAVLRVQVRGRRDLVTVVGYLPSVSPGEHLQAEGDWFNDPVHGLQFKSTSVRSSPPMTPEGIERYLGSGLVKGVGPHFARRLVAAFGVDVFDVIEREPGRLREVDGIGPVRAERIAGSWNQQKAVRDIMVFLHAHGVGTQRAVRIYRTYGPDAIRLIRENPYRLAADIRGIGFVTADQVAARLGIEKTALIRARAGIGYTLARATDEGHCGLPATSTGPAASASRACTRPRSRWLRTSRGSPAARPPGRPSTPTAPLPGCRRGWAWCSPPRRPTRCGWRRAASSW
jgi:exodeoxyribonuclease V alpha subunit